jgi:ABC-type dipeptide/oligopeptide/nickel transport system permease component
MKRYVLRRLLQTIPILWGVATLVFAMLYVLPGDPVSAMLSQSGASAETMARLRQQLGLDDPLLVQYWRFLSNALRGDLGNSIFQNRPVVTLIAEQLPATIELTTAAMTLAVLVGTGLGVLAAVRQNSWIDRLSIVLATIGVSMPTFWLGLLFIFFFSLSLGWLPALGQGGLERLVMPAAVLGLSSAAAIARLVRSSLLEVLRQDYVRTAWAKGLTEPVVVFRHGLRNALIPVVTILGLQFGWLLGGAVITETVFSRQGIGRLAVGAILTKDVPVVQGAVLLSATFYVLINLLVDLSYAVLDPRITYDA